MPVGLQQLRARFRTFQSRSLGLGSAPELAGHSDHRAKNKSRGRCEREPPTFSALLVDLLVALPALGGRVHRATLTRFDKFDSPVLAMQVTKLASADANRGSRLQVQPLQKQAVPGPGVRGKVKP